MRWKKKRRLLVYSNYPYRNGTCGSYWFVGYDGSQKVLGKSEFSFLFEYFRR